MRRCSLPVLVAVLCLALAAPAVAHRSKSDRATIQKLRKQNANLLMQIRTESARLGGAGSLAARVTAVLTSVGDLTTKLGAAEGQVGSLTTQIATRNDQIGGLNSQVSELTTERNAANVQISGLNSQVSELTSERNAANAQIDSATSALGGTGSLAARITAVDGLLGGSGTTNSRATATIGLATEINDAQSALGGTGTLAARITAVNGALGSTGATAERVENVEDALRADGAQTNVAGDVAALRDVVAGGGLAANFAADLTAINNFLGGASSPTSTRIADTYNIIGLIDATESAYPDAVTGTNTLRGRVTDVFYTLAMGNATIAADLEELHGATGLGGTADTATQARVNDVLTSLKHPLGPANNNTESTNFDAPFASFNSATSVTGLLDAFRAVFDTGGTRGGLRIPDNNYATLANLLSAARDDGLDP